MQNFIKVGVGVIILNDGKILLGHRTASRGDTGGYMELVVGVSLPFCVTRNKKSKLFLFTRFLERANLWFSSKHSL